MSYFKKMIFNWIFLISILLGIVFSCNSNLCEYKNYVNALEVPHISYAKAKDNCFLFKTSDVTNSNYTNVFFVVPKTYFVTVLSKINTFIFKVQYKNKIGYVASDSVTEVSFVPVNPTLENVTFDALDMVGTQLRSLPNAEDSTNIIMIVPAGSSMINYVSFTYSTVPSGGTSNVWYYAVYQPVTDPTSVYEGYIYSEKVKNLSVISENQEGMTSEANETNPDATDEKFIEYSMLNSSIKTVLIILICMPIVIIFILLIAGNKSKKHECETNFGNSKTDKTFHDKSKSSRRSVENLKGKTFKEKVGSSIVSKEVKTDKLSPVFPTYEVIDDDDLL